MKTYVLYHTSCYDGLGAAYSAWKRFGDIDVEYIPVAHGKPPPKMDPKSQVFILDMSYGPETIEAMAKEQEWVTILDHHESAMKLWAGPEYKDDFYATDRAGEQTNVTIIFDMKVSGAGIAWDALLWNPDSNRNERPRFINLIEDRDLWKFKLEGSRAFHSYLLSVPKDFRYYEKFEDEDYLNSCIKEGTALLRMTNEIVETICKNATVCDNFLGYRVVICNTTSHWSEVGNRLLEIYPDVNFACAYTDMKDGVRMFSLRSNGNFDVSKVAAEYGGGGHKAAAGFKARPLVPFSEIAYERIEHK